MLLTQRNKIMLSPFFETKFNEISNYLKMLFKHEPTAFLHFEDFHDDFCICVTEFYAAVSQNKMIDATKIIDHFYSKWIDTSLLPLDINNAMDAAIASGLASLVMIHLSVQLAYITHYSLCTSASLIMLFIKVGFKVTTPEWVSVGFLSGGKFKCNVVRANLKHKTYRLFR